MLGPGSDLSCLGVSGPNSLWASKAHLRISPLLSKCSITPIPVRLPAKHGNTKPYSGSIKYTVQNKKHKTLLYPSVALRSPFCKLRGRPFAGHVLTHPKTGASTQHHAFCAHQQMSPCQPPVAHTCSFRSCGRKMPQTGFRLKPQKLLFESLLEQGRKTKELLSSLAC